MASNITDINNDREKMEPIRFFKIESGGDVVYLNNAGAHTYGVEYNEESTTRLYSIVCDIINDADKAGVARKAPSETCAEAVERLITWIKKNYKDFEFKAEYVGPVCNLYDDDEEDLTEGLSDEMKKELAEMNKQIKRLTVE